MPICKSPTGVTGLERAGEGGREGGMEGEGGGFEMPDGGRGVS